MKMYELAFVLVAALAAVIIGIGSSYILGNDNVVEEIAEDVLGDFIEETLNLPEDTIDFDFSPGEES